MKFSHVLSLGIAMVVLAGCATVYEGKYDFNEGWREAEILEIASAAKIGKSRFSDCRDSATAEQLATDKFAVLSYQRMGRTKVHVVALHPGQTFRLGDLVYAKVSNCSAPIVVRRGSRP